MALSGKTKIVIAIVGGAVAGALTACGAVWIHLAPIYVALAGGVVALVVAITGYKIFG